MFISKDEGNARNETILCPLPLFATKNRETCETEHLMLHCSFWDFLKLERSFLKLIHDSFSSKMKIFCQDFCVVCSVPFIFKRRRHLLSFPRIILGRSISHPISLCETEEKTWLSPSSSLSSVSLEGKDGLRKLSTQCANWLKSSLNQPQWPD